MCQGEPLTLEDTLLSPLIAGTMLRRWRGLKHFLTNKIRVENYQTNILNSKFLSVLSSYWCPPGQDVPQVDGGPHHAVVNAGYEGRIGRRQSEQVGHSEYRERNGGGPLVSLLSVIM